MLEDLDLQPLGAGSQFGVSHVEVAFRPGAPARRVCGCYAGLKRVAARNYWELRAGALTRLNNPIGQLQS